MAKYEKQITVQDVLTGKADAMTAKELKASESMAVLYKLVDHAENNDWDDAQADNIVTFVRALPAEQMVHLWNSVMATKNMGPIKALHSRIGDEIVAVIREARNLSN